MRKICSPYIRLKNGTILHAKDYGKKVFCWNVTEEQHKEYLEKKRKEKQDKK